MADGASSSGAASASGPGGGGGGESVVIDYGRRRTACGYCRSTGQTSISHGKGKEKEKIVVDMQDPPVYGLTA
uniref:Arginyl-tRNA--protein transferase n=2 Tax=Oryza TaxID=4527 RepID=A0A0E0HF96_ORYNI